MRKIATPGIFMMVLLITGPIAATAAAPPAVGGVLPDIRLAAPKDSVEKNYLGLSGSGVFTIPQIRTNVVVIEIFSMYCPYCQAEAPVVNSLYSKIENDAALKGKVKLIGIGVGNSPFEVDVFRKKYTIPFPLFADGDFVIHKMVGEVRTPYFIAVRINPDGSHRVVASKLGRLEGVDQFLASIAKLAGLP
jgi:thiol-disulfide isomerase/thioredoxin